MYKVELRKQFALLEKSETPLSQTSKLLLMYQGLNNIFKPNITTFEHRTLNYITATMANRTKLCL